MKKKLILIGGGGHCKSCIDVIEQEDKYIIEGILDLPENIGKKVLNYPIIGSDDEIEKYHEKGYTFFITVGQISSSDLRSKIYNKLKVLNAKIATIISPIAYVSKYATIGEGTIIMHQALINAEAEVGNNVIINSKALIEHEAVIGDYCHISTDAKINGQVVVKESCFVGSGATIANNVTLTNNVIIPAGTAVYKNVEKSGIYIRR